MGQGVDDQSMECHQNGPTTQHEGYMHHYGMRCVDQDEVAEAGRMGKTQGCMEHGEMGCVEQDDLGQRGPSMEQWNVAWNKVPVTQSCHYEALEKCTNLQARPHVHQFG